MTIEPLPGIVQLKIDQAKIGVLDTSSRNTAVEFAEIAAKGDGVNMEIGDKVFVKAWGVDIVEYNGEKYYFVNVENKSILAVVRE